MKNVFRINNRNENATFDAMYTICGCFQVSLMSFYQIRTSFSTEKITINCETWP